jgi:hypothetical protein
VIDTLEIVVLELAREADSVVRGALPSWHLPWAALSLSAFALAIALGTSRHTSPRVWAFRSAVILAAAGWAVLGPALAIPGQVAGLSVVGVCALSAACARRPAWRGTHWACRGTWLLCAPAAIALGATAAVPLAACSCGAWLTGRIVGRERPPTGVADV